ncbi:MAG: HEAT repeat domain-containing protein [Acidobacteriota bacterium]
MKTLVTFVLIACLSVPVAWAQTAVEEPEAITAKAALLGLESPVPEERIAAAKQLSQLAVDVWTQDYEEVMPIILTALDDPEDEVRIMAAVSLFQATWVVWGTLEMNEEQEAVLQASGPKLRHVYPEILARLEDPNATVREYLLRALGTWMPQIPEGLTPSVLEKVDDSSTQVAGLALKILGRAGNRSPEVTDKIVGVLEARPSLRATAAAVLGELYQAGGFEKGADELPVEISEALLNAANDEDEVTQLAALRALGRIELSSEEARSHLTRLSEDESEEDRVRKAAEITLSGLDVSG